MGLEQAIHSALTAGSPRTDAEGRVFNRIAPEGAGLPRVTFLRVATVPQNSLSGHSGLDQVLVQVDSWARTPLAAATLARQVRLLMGGQPFKALPQNEFSDMEVESKLYRHTVEFSCWDKSF